MYNAGEAQLRQLLGNYKLTPATLMAEIAPWWQPAPFLQLLSAEIARCVATGGCGLLVSAPPRHGKSKLITVATPLWVLENFPTKNVIVCTYGEDLSTDFTREVKDLIKGNPDKLSIRIRRDVDRAQNFVTPQGGGLKAVGLRGTITGRGADVLIIDDYIKEPKEALSFDYLESLKTWYATVARTRLEPGAVVIIVATRWVTNDLHGHIERLEARRTRKFYKSMKIQAIAGDWDIDNHQWIQGKILDPMNRKPGEALFPQRYPVADLENIREELGARWFNAMFQQNPQADDSAVTNPENLRLISRTDFEERRLRWHNQVGRLKWRRGWDFASTKNAGDFTAGPRTAWDSVDDNFYLDALVHGQYSAGRVEMEFMKADNNDYPEVEYVVEQEPGSAGVFAIDHFKGLVPTRKFHEVKAASGTSKLLKAQPFLAATEAHKVFLVVDDIHDINKTPWAQRFIDEFTTFPEGGHDDIMDGVCSAYNHATGRKMFRGSWGRSPEALARREQIRAQGPGTKTPDDSKPRRYRATWGRKPHQRA